MKKAVIYIHGRGGSAKEAAHYIPLFPDCDVTGLDYKAQTPWEAAEEFPVLTEKIFRDYGSVSLIANSIGAYFAMISLADKRIEKAFFISPVVNFEKLIEGMMLRSGVSEDELKERGEILTESGELLSWKYLCYVREHPARRIARTHILYGSADRLVQYGDVSAFAEKTGATLTVMQDGEHWFHTEEQMKFLDEWIRRCKQQQPVA